ncbi:Uncharacterized protein APZ42_017052 [Daphnia magna]|uniref:Uncharacterized protein n=1 Tax=Daphnia magna TaxID=35525 RepID=A0A165A285_9CRUS|nr:Uncharacterized protein APZ42_017052 [Daphnia magna]
MGPIDPEGGDMKAIVAGSPSSGSSSLNMTSPVVIVPVIDERPTVTTITVTGVDGTLQNNGEASSTTPAVQTPVVACAQPCGYSSAYVTNRMHNTQLGGKTSNPSCGWRVLRIRIHRWNIMFQNDNPNRCEVLRNFICDIRSCFLNCIHLNRVIQITRHRVIYLNLS